MKWKKQAMSLVLTGCLAAGMLVPAAMAADIQPDISEQIVAAIGEKQAASNSEYLATKATVDKIFHDVEAGSWYCSYVQAAYDMGLMSGESDTTFAPNKALTRAMFVQILYNGIVQTFGQPSVDGKSSFSDVKEDAWYYNAVVWAEKEGISAGMGDGTFQPNANIPREQLAVMLYHYAERYHYSQMPEADAAVIAKYPDVKKVSSWAEEAMVWANSEGLINGTDQGGTVYLNPKGNTTRAEAATILSKYFADKM